MKFTYEIKTKSGKNQKGEIEAIDQFSAMKALREQKFAVLTLKAKRSIPFISKIHFPISSKDKIIFAEQLAVMVKAGLPLIEALASLKEQTSNKDLVIIINELAIDVKGGNSFSQSLSKYPKVFPSYFVNVIRSGEKSGNLDQVLRRLADQMTKDYDLVSKVRGAMIYPSLILVALIGLVILILVYIIPNLKEIFNEVGAELPLLTRMVIGLADFTKKFIILIFILLIGLAVFLKRSMKNSQYRLYFDKIKLKIPIFGRLYKNIYMARFSRNAGTLVAAGLPILEILKTISNIIGNELYRRSLEDIAKQVEGGAQISAAIKRHPVFPPMVGNLLSVGERSGSMEQVLFTLADFFDREVDNTTRNLTTILEPVMMLIMGAGVALIIAAVIMPIYNLVNVV